MREKNLIDRLLETDITKLERPSKNIKIKRLSEIFGFEFEITLKVMPSILETDIFEKATTSNKKGEIDVDVRKMHNLTLVDSVYAGDKLLFRDKELMKKFGAETPFELIDKMLTAGEKSSLYDAYNDLSGYQNDSISIVEEVKN